ncbi:MAG: outer membrane protein assembly factor BamA [Elusimicrobia bacterium]|nr:outer membrane protein assembly factor BamA [Elusimicrobiota bacterium]
MTAPALIVETSSAAPTVSTATVPSPPSTIPATIVEVLIQGNKNVRKRVIEAEIKLRKGDRYDEAMLQQKVQALYRLGSFEDVTVDVTDLPADGPGGLAGVGGGLKGKRVTFRVVEKPIIKRIDFKGIRQFSRSKLKDEISLKEQEPFDKFKLQADIQKVVSLYKEKGFAAVVVEHYTTLDEKSNQLTLTFFVTEGSRVVIREIQFPGATVLSKRRLLKLMKSRPKKVFKDDILVKDLQELTRWYQNHGYQNVKVKEPQQVFNEDRTRLDLTIAIEEGPQFSFGAVTFHGHTIFATQDLIKTLQFEEGDIFNKERLDATLAKLQEMYGEKGYLRVQVKPEFKQDLAEGAVDVDFQIDEGNVVFVDRIFVDGNTHTKTYVLRREILLKEGQVFNWSSARRSVEKLYNLGFLDNVDVDIQQPSGPQRADVVFTVTEGKPGILSAGAGFSSVDGLLGTLQVQHINLFGRAQRLNLLWEFGARRQNYEIGWTEPWFLGKPMSFGLDLRNLVRLRQFRDERSAFKERRQGGAVRLGPRLSETLSLAFTYSYDRVRLFDINSRLRQEIINLQPAQKEVSNISSLTSQVIHDTRDNIFDANRGHRYTSSMQVAGGPLGGNVSFYAPTVTGSWFLPTFWKFVFSLNARAGFIREYGSSRQVPVTERFIMGGPDTVRGYNLGEVGKKQGGTIMALGNAEYKFPIAPDVGGRTLLQGAFFLDIGGAWEEFGEVRYKIGRGDFNLKTAIGFGIRFKTPVFPLRLDWGYGLNHKPGEELSQIHFTVGNLF